MRTVSLRFILGALLLTALNACEQAAKTPVEGSLVAMDGKSFDFSSYRGKWVLINYWASWCSPCKKEIPELNAFYKAHKDGNVVLLGVNYDGLGQEILPKVISEAHIAYPNLLRDPAPALKLGKIPGIPVTFVFTPEGILKQKLFGEQTVASLERVIKAR